MGKSSNSFNVGARNGKSAKKTSNKKALEGGPGKRVPVPLIWTLGLDVFLVFSLSLPLLGC